MSDEPSAVALDETGVFSERQITLPLTIAVLITIACYFTFGFFFQPGGDGLLARYLSNGFCLLIACVFTAATIYAALHYLGLAIERYHLALFSRQAPPGKPLLYRLACFLSGRSELDRDGLMQAMRRWYDNARSGEDFANLSDHMLLLRERQHQHNLAPLTFVIWVMPLLGFIGTVIGITRAIGGLQEVVAVAGASAGGLEGVLAGLRFAFDTTFVGLLLVIPAMLYTMPLRTRAQKLDMHYYEILVNRSFDGKARRA